jgi:hypothetical protein
MFASRLSLILLAAFFFFPSPLRACECKPDSPPHEAFDKAEAVFAGKVVRIEDISFPRRAAWNVLSWFGFGRSTGPYGYTVTIDVAISWKGVQTKSTQVMTGYGGGDCGYPFEVGKEFLVYGSRNSGVLVTSICSRTNDVSIGVADDLTYLTRLQELSLTTNGVEAPFSRWLIAAAIALALILVFWELRRRRKGNSRL